MQPSWSIWDFPASSCFFSFLFEDSSKSHSFYIVMFLYASRSPRLPILPRDPNVHRTNLRWPQIAKDFSTSATRPGFSHGISEFFPPWTPSWASSHVCKIPSVSKELIQRSEGKEKSGRPARALQVTYRVLTQIIEAGPWPQKVKKALPTHRKDGWKMKNGCKGCQGSCTWAIRSTVWRWRTSATT